MTLRTAEQSGQGLRVPILPYLEMARKRRQRMLCLQMKILRILYGMQAIILLLLT